jgi:hypothetical protein
MRVVKTTLLLHTTAEGAHHDWLIEDPSLAGDAERGLWAARVAHPSRAWASLGRFDLIPLPPHRRRYLDYEGPLTDGRGHVRRVDHGTILPLLWAQGRLILDVRLQHFCGRLELRAAGPDLWRAHHPPQPKESGV